MKGRIKNYNLTIKTGTIAVQGQRDYLFWENCLQDGAGSKDVKEQMEVEIISWSGNRAEKVRLVGFVKSENQMQHEKTIKTNLAINLNQSKNIIPAFGASAPRFLNPYNFVRLPQEAPKAVTEKTDPQIALLHRCMPPTHDRYVGLTGAIECRATVKTPLFIPDSHEVASRIVVRKVHKTYRFFRVANKPIVPASSLRGMLRSVYETATGSCLSVFDGDRRLSWRYPTDESWRLVPGRISKDGVGIFFEPLPGDTKVDLVASKRPFRMIPYGAWVKYYSQPLKSKGVPNLNHDYGRRKVQQCPEGWKPGDEVYAILHRITHPVKQLTFWNVRRWSLDEDSLKAEMQPGEKLEKGYIYITNQNIDNKHDERFFFRSDTENRQIPQKISLSEIVVKKWGDLINDYRDRFKDAVKKNNNPVTAHDGQAAFSSFVLKPELSKLNEGDLVYGLLGMDKNELVVKELAPVSVPRIFHENTIKELLPDEQWLECKEYEELCPACRLFGWVKGDKATDAAKRAAYRGRVRILHGTVNEAKCYPIRPVSLAILGGPKPTTARFYLQTVSGDPLGKKYNEMDCLYQKGQNMLRGRKFYRHHGTADPAEYTRKDADSRNDDQNRTVEGALNAGTEFRFKLFYENLAPVELGALLWTLELEDGMHHRLGYAKPLGFGSIDVKVEMLSVVDLLTRYAGSRDSGLRMLAADEKTALVNEFKSVALRRFGLQFKEFLRLPHIHDLQILLKKPEEPLPVHYPRAAPQIDAEGKNFLWFMGNKKTKLPLPCPGEGESLPYQSKFGIDGRG